MEKVLEPVQEELQALRRSCVEKQQLLMEVLQVLEKGGDFQLGPKGKHFSLPDRIRSALVVLGK